MTQAVTDGARSTRTVAELCGAGSVCGRCRSTIRALIAAGEDDAEEAADAGRPEGT